MKKTPEINYDCDNRNDKKDDTDNKINIIGPRVLTERDTTIRKNKMA